MFLGKAIISYIISYLPMGKYVSSPHGESKYKIQTTSAIGIRINFHSLERMVIVPTIMKEIYLKYL